MNGSTTPAVGDFKDSTQYANNSINNTNEPTVATGQVDGAQSFNGTSSYVDVGNGGSLNPTYVTAEAWIYPKTSALAYGVVLDKAYTSHTTPYYQYEIRLLYTAGNVTSIDFYLSSVVKLDSTSSVQSLSLNSWHHLVGTYDGSSIKLYIDGVLVNTKALTGNLTSFATNLQIGKFRNLANGFFSGSIDEVRISNTARSAGWIATEYNNQSQPTEFSTLGIEEVSAPSALSSFAYRKAITIDHTKVSGSTNLTNFPVLINLPTDDSLKAHSQSTGNDILFTSSTVAWNTGTTNDKLAHEIETYTASNGSLQAWVKIPSLNSASATQDTVIYMYYGNASIASQQNKTAVWDTNTKMVQHLKETGTNPTVYDSTQYANNSTAQTWTPTTAGQIDGAGSFDGTSNQINVGHNDSLNITNAVTLEAWVKSNTITASGDWRKIFGKTDDTFVLYQEPNNAGFYLSSNVGGVFRYTKFANGDTNTYHHLVATFDSGTSKIKVYNNGAFVSEVSTSGVITTASNINTVIGGVAMQFFTGSIDEVRISNTARSAGWIATEYNNQSIPLKTELTPTGFLALGAENIYRLEITGSSTQTASISQPITLTAKDVAGNIMANFTGDNTLTLGGASASPNNTNPTCSDKNAVDILFGTPTTLNFVSGVATCNMKLYKVETANVTATGISTVTTNLSVTVSPNTLNNFFVDAPASGNSGTAFATNITSRDAYNNTTTNLSGSTALTVNQGGTIAPTSISAGNFTDDGIWSGNLTITNITEQPSVAITVTNDIYTGSDSISILGIPTTPQNASATRNTDYSMTLTWQDSSTVETGYKIERKVNEGSGFGDYAQIGTVAAGISTFTDDATYPDRSYQYRVRAYNSIGDSAAYAEDSIIHYTTSDMPSNVFGSFVSDTNFNINYTDQADVTDTHRIQRCSNANCSDTFETDLGTFTTSPQTDTTSIYPDSRYRWQVRAEAPSITSNYAVSDFEYTTPATPIIQNTTFVSNTQLNVNWTDSSSYEDGFRIEVSTDGGAYQEITPNTNTVGAGVVSYAYSGITLNFPEQTFKFY